MNTSGREKARATFVVPATAGNYAPERITFGVIGPSTLNVEEQYQGVTIFLESAPAGAVAELWLPKVGTRPDAAGAPEDADYLYAGKALTSGFVTTSLAGYVGAQIRVKSGGTAGSAVVSASATKLPVAADSGSGLTAGAEQGVGSFYGSSETTRPANTDAYAVGDVIANSTTTGDVVFGAIEVASAPGGSVRIDHIRAATDQATNVAQLRIHLYSKPRASLTTATPVDNALNITAFNNGADYRGFIDLLPMSAEAGVNTGARSKVVNPQHFFRCADADTKLYFLIQTQTAFTPASAQKFRLYVGGTRY